MPVSPGTKGLIIYSLPFLSCYLESEDEPQQPCTSSRRNIRPLFFHPRHINSQPQADPVTLHRQHKHEISFPWHEQSKDLVSVTAYGMNSNLSFHPGKYYAGTVHDKNLLCRISPYPVTEL